MSKYGAKPGVVDGIRFDSKCSTATTTGAEGNKYRKLTAVRYVGMNKYHKAEWEFICDCGKTHIAALSEVKHGHITSCGCARLGKQSHNTLPPGESSRRNFYPHIVKSARKRGHTWSLNEDEVFSIVSRPCHYCGRPPMQEYKSNYQSNGAFIYNGIDRIDNSVGYENENVVPCCKECNRAKSTMGIDEFLLWVTSVYNHSIARKNE